MSLEWDRSICVVAITSEHSAAHVEFARFALARVIVEDSEKRKKKKKGG